MAKSKKLELDDFGIDNDLDFPDFDYKPGKIKEDRNPATKLGKAFVGGAKDTALTPQFLRKMLKQSLPRGYGSTMDLGDQSVDSLKNAYHSAAKEIKPALNDIKRTTQRAMPTISKVVPKGVAEAIKKWSTSDERKAEASRDQQREDALQMMLGDVFKFQATTGAKERQEDEIKDRLKEGIAQSRHRDQLGQLDAIRTGIAQMAAYQQKIDSSFQRKSLELQFRQYYVAIDMLEETKRQNASTTTALEAIMKNTGLPDFVKLKNSERLADIMRNNFLGAIGEGIFDKRRDFVKNIAKRGTDILKDKALNFANSVRGATDAANMAMDANDMMSGMGDFGPSKKEIGAGLAGGLAADAGGSWVARKLGARLAKNKNVVRRGNQLQQMTENVPQIVGRWARSSKGETGIGILDSLLNFGKDVVNSESMTPNGKLNVDGLNNLQEQSLYTRQANKSITEIIPGFLSRIYRELQVMRTGNDKIELTTYDYKGNRFSSTSEANRNAISSIVGGYGKEGTKNQLDTLLDQVDPKKTLTPQERLQLGQQLLKDNLNNQYGDKSYFTNRNSFGENGEKVAGLFKDHLAGDEFGNKEHNLNRSFQRLGSSLGDSREAIQNMANAGMMDFLLESGVVNADTGSIDMDRLYELNYGGEYTPKISGAGAGIGKLQSAVKPRRQKAARPRNQRFQDAGSNRLNQPNFNEELVKTLREQDARPIAQAMAETLMRIEARLGMGLATYQQAAPPSQTEASGWNMSIKSAMGKLGHKVGRGIAFAKRQADSIVGQFTGLVGTGMGMGKELLQTGIDRFKMIRDVYVPGEVIPRLTAWKMKAGMYKDQATGKVIKSFKDIAGAVVDENGNVVLDPSEIKAAFVKYGPVKKLISLMGAALNTAREIGNNLFAGLPGMARLGLTAVKSTWDGLLNRAEDVYVKGQQSPVLRAAVMKAGGYFSKLTGKVIRHPGEIDGPVLDAEGNVVLTGEDLKGGVLNKWGQQIETGARKLLALGLGLAGKGIKAVVGGAKWLKDQVAGGFRGVGDWFSRFSLPDGILFSGGKTMVQRLTEIRDLLTDRLPDRKKVFGDVNGDGVREGSYEDIMAKRQKQQDAVKGERAATGDKAAGGGGIGALLSKLMNRKKSEEEEGDDGSLLDDAADVADIADAAGNRRGRRAGRAGKGKGLWNRVKGVGKFGMKGAGKMLGLAGAAYGGYSAYKNLQQGNYGEAAVDTGLTAGGLALSAGAGWGLLGTIGAGIGAIIGSPVLLGAAAVAAVGAAGYYGYKFLTKKRLGIVSKYRYAQYGFNEKDTDHLNAVFGLEDKLEGAIITKDGKPDLDVKKVDLKSLAEDFGVDRKNLQEVQNWAAWFAQRFKAVYLTNIAALKAVAPQGRLANVDELKPAELKKYFGLAKFTEGPYDLLASPFPNLKFLDMNSSKVAAVGQAVEAELAKQPLDKKDSTGLSTNVAPATAGATVAGAAAVNASNSQPAGDLGKTTANLLSKQDTASVSGLSLSVGATFQGWSTPSNGELDALSAVRFKTYGLGEMVSEKVRALQLLESVVEKNVSYSGKGVAMWTGNVTTTVLTAGGAFGVSGSANNGAYDWQAWFKTRFLPVYLNYLTALKSAGGKMVAMGSPMLSAAAAVDVATAVFTTKDVWSVEISPWQGYHLNVDPKTVEANLQALREQSQKTTMREQTGNKESKGTGTDSGTGITDGTKAPGVMSRAWDSVKGFAQRTSNAVTSTASAAWQGTKDAANSAYKAVDSGLTTAKNAVVTGANAAMGAGGAAMTALKDGVGGLLAQVPMPTADGTYAGMKALIDKASEMVGVDPKLMATMAAIESGFRATVKAGTSSATGLYQFISGTWKTMVKKYGAKYGIDASTPPTDPRANALMGAEFIKENAKALSGVKANLTDTDLYLAHFLGAGGAKQFLKSDPNAIAANVMPAAANANRSIFYNRDGSARSIAETYAEINRRVRSKGKQFGLDSGNAQPLDAGGGRGSINPAAAVPDAAGSTGIADAPGAGGGRGAINPALPSAPVIPVSNTAPGGAAPSAPVPSTPTPAYNAAADSQAASSPVGGGGFSPTAGTNPQSQALVAQNQGQRDAMTQILGSIDTTGQKALTIAADQLAALRQIAEILGRSGAPGASPAGASANDAAGPTTRRAAAITSPPVSMAKS